MRAFNTTKIVPFSIHSSSRTALQDCHSSMKRRPRRSGRRLRTERKTHIGIQGPNRSRPRPVQLLELRQMESTRSNTVVLVVFSTGTPSCHRRQRNQSSLQESRLLPLPLFRPLVHLRTSRRKSIPQILLLRLFLRSFTQWVSLKTKLRNTPISLSHTSKRTSELLQRRAKVIVLRHHHLHRVHHRVKL